MGATTVKGVGFGFFRKALDFTVGLYGQHQLFRNFAVGSFVTQVVAVVGAFFGLFWAGTGNVPELLPLFLLPVINYCVGWVIHFVAEDSESEHEGYEYIYTTLTYKPPQPENSWGFETPEMPWVNFIGDAQRIWSCRRKVIGVPAKGASVEAPWEDVLCIAQQEPAETSVNQGSVNPTQPGPTTEDLR